MDNGQNGITSENDNGKLIETLVTDHELTIMNFDPRCSGKWTWARQNRQSIVDYIIMDDSLARQMTAMTIDDMYKQWSIGSDHTFIQVCMKIGVQNPQYKTPTSRMWQLGEKTEWGNYQRELTKQLTRWKVELNKNTQGFADRDVLKTVYDKLQGIIKQVADKTLRKKKSTVQKLNISSSYKKKGQWQVTNEG